MEEERTKQEQERQLQVQLQIANEDREDRQKNEKDNILYILLTQETTMYGYIMSILRYLGIFKAPKN